MSARFSSAHGHPIFLGKVLKSHFHPSAGSRRDPDPEGSVPGRAGAPGEQTQLCPLRSSQHNLVATRQKNNSSVTWGMFGMPREAALVGSLQGWFPSRRGGGGGCSLSPRHPPSTETAKSSFLIPKSISSPQKLHIHGEKGAQHPQLNERYFQGWL